MAIDRLTSVNRVTNICAGSFHSLAVDENGSVWSWGSRGHPCLGQGLDSLSLAQSSWTNQMKNTFASPNSSSLITVPYELLEWVKIWSKPRKIECFDNIDVQLIGLSAGNEFSAFHFKDGSLYLAGSGHVIPTQNSASLQSHQPIYYQPTRLPSAWISNLGTKKCVMVHGSGDKIFALFDGESITQSLTNPLYRRIRAGQSLDEYIDSSALDNDVLSADKQSISEEIFNQPDGYSLLQSYGLADCLIVAAGRVLAAHRAILAARSPVLRDMILSELPLDEEEDGANDIIQLLLPELRADTAYSFLYYLYTDSVPSAIIRNSIVVKSLLSMGKLFKIPRLQMLCQCLVAANTALELSRLGVTEDDDSMANFQIERPPMTLSKVRLSLSISTIV